ALAAEVIVVPALRAHLEVRAELLGEQRDAALFAAPEDALTQRALLGCVGGRLRLREPAHQRSMAYHVRGPRGSRHASSRLCGCTSPWPRSRSASRSSRPRVPARSARSTRSARRGITARCRAATRTAART